MLYDNLLSSTAHSSSAQLRFISIYVGVCVFRSAVHYLLFDKSDNKYILLEKCVHLLKNRENICHQHIAKNVFLRCAKQLLCAWKVISMN